MQCPRCQHENPPQAKFCLECGASLGLTCGSCGIDLPATARFCLQCGKPVATELIDQPRFAAPESYTPKHLAEKILTSRSALEGERKQVTVLFADLKGSMELLAERDPEEARMILDPVLALMMEAVHDYEGTVNQVMGDGIMALFGAPLAHENHAVRACYAALRMQESVRRYAEEAQNRFGVAIRIRVGLNSGDVVVRSIGSDLHMDYTAVGQTTHLAARMEQMADPGSILMSGEILALVAGHVQVKPLGRHVVKGLSKPIDVCQVVGAAHVRSRFAAAALTRFVGRNRQMDEVYGVLDLAQGGMGQVVAVIGEPGVGKSRFFWEFTQSSRVRDWLVVETGPTLYGKAAAYLYAVELLRSYFQVDTGDGTEKVRDKVEDKLLSFEAALRRAALPACLWLLDVPLRDAEWERLDPPTRRERALDSIRLLLLAQSQVRPLLLLVENLHWIDADSQALLDSLVEALGAARILLLVNYRPEYQHAWGSRTYYRQLRMGPLTPENARTILGQLLGEDASLETLKRMLIERTEGNPLFLEECVKSLMDTDALVGEPGQYRVARLAQTLQVPPTVQAILAARIDRLAPEHKAALQAAAVVGRNVEFALLKEIAGQHEDALRQAVRALQSGEFLYETSVFPKVEFTFKHALTHDVAYGSLLGDRRRRLHTQIVDAFEQLYPHLVAEQADWLAYQALRGGLWEKATGYFLRAGQRSIQRSAYAEALKHLRAGLEVLPRLSPTTDRMRTELEFQVSLGSAVLATRGWGAPEVEGIYARAQELCDAVGQTQRLFPVLWGITTFYLLRCHVQRAVASAEQFLALAERSADDAPRLVGHFLVGNTVFWTGDLTRTQSHLEASLALYDPHRHEGLADVYGQDIRATAMCYRGWTLWFQGYPDQALRYHDEAVRLATERNHPHTIAYTEGIRLYTLQLRDAPDVLLERARSAIAFADEQGAAFWSAFDRVACGWATARTGDAANSVAEMRQTLDAYRDGGSEVPVIAMRLMLVDACLRDGKPNEALAEASLALNLVALSEDRAWEPEVYRLMGECLLAAPDGSQQEAEAYFRRAVAVARSRNAKSWELRATVSLCRWLSKRGRAAEARDILARIYAWFTEGFEATDLRDAQALLAEIG
jgi:class 3 adenylate cyclase/predicted ATPase